VILVHAYLGLGRDTDSYAELTAGFDYDNERDGGSLVHPVEVANIVCDEDPTQSLVEETRFGRAALLSIAERPLAELILAGLDDPAAVCSATYARGSPRATTAAAERQHQDERSEGAWPIPTSRRRVGPLPVRSFASSRGCWARLADELASGREGQAYSADCRRRRSPERS
jgi:hypothetical protein